MKPIVVISICRWDWVTGGRPGSGGNSDSGSASSPRSNECKLHRRKLHKKLLHQMQELEAARRGIQVALEEQQVRYEANFCDIHEININYK